MLKRILSFDVRGILRWDVGAAIKGVSMFDLNRILYADLDQVLSHPVPQIVLKATLGWFAAVMLTLFVALLTLDTITPAVERVQAFVCLALVVAFITGMSEE